MPCNAPANPEVPDSRPATAARIVARTDQIYEIAEEMKPKFEGAVMVLCSRLGVKNVVFGGLKDPVRIHEKALDEDVMDFDDWETNCVIPEACVLDVLRCRAVCPDAHRMQRLMEALGELIDTSIRSVKFLLIRVKNTFASVDSTHFRNLIFNLKLTASDGCRMQSAYAGMQVSHLALLKHNDDSHAQDHLNFFRSLLTANYGPGLDTMLARALEFLKGAASVSVLLSMLVLTFKHHKEGDSLPLPVDLFELYQQALSLKMPTEAPATTETVLRALAYANQRTMRCEFTSADVADALVPEDQAHWKKLIQRGTVPLIEVQKNDAICSKRGEGLFKFKHRAFQEALAAQVLIADPTKLVPRWDGGAQATETLTQAFHHNMLHIGSGRLRAALGGSEWMFEQRLCLQREGWQAIASLICGNNVLTTLDLRRIRLASEAAKALVPGLISGAFTAIGQGGLNLKDNQVGDEAWFAIFAGVCGSKESKIASIDVSSERIGLHGAELIAKTLQLSERGSLTEVNLDGFELPVKKLKGTDPVEALDLTGKGLGVASAIVISALIGINGELKSLSLGENELGDDGAEALSVGLKKNRTLYLHGKGYGKGCIGSRGVLALASAIATMSVLTRCELRQNNLGVEGWTSIFNALRGSRSSKITEWNLSYEALGPGIAKSLGEYLSVTSVLTKCELRGNQLGVKGWTIFNALRSSPTSKITTWDLSDEWLGPEIAEPLAEYISVAGALTKLDVQLSYIGEEEEAALQHAVTERSHFELKLTSVELPLSVAPRAATAPAFSLRAQRTT